MQTRKSSELSIILTSLIFHCELAMINFCPSRSSTGKWVVLRRELGGNAVDGKSVAVGIWVGYQVDLLWAKKSTPPVRGGFWKNTWAVLYIAVCLYKQLLNKEGWASDMFITSTFSVIRSRSLWSCFHAQAILPYILIFLIVLGFNDTSTLEGHFVSSPREREKRDRRESRGDEREGQGRKRNRNESEETEEIKTFPLYPYPLQG